MSHDALEDRRKALEEQFFKQQNELLVRKLKETAHRAASKEELRNVTGITNDEVLDALAELEMGAAAQLIMAMYPVVEVAWADGEIDAKERQVLLEQASSFGIKQGTEAALFLAHWLDERPAPTWHKIWAAYVQALSKVMPKPAFAKLKVDVLGRARLVAEASGGVLGLGFAVSAAEKKCLESLAKAFG